MMMRRRFAPVAMMQTQKTVLSKHIEEIKKALGEFDKLIGLVPSSKDEHDKIQSKIKDVHQNLQKIIIAVNAKNVISAKFAIKTTQDSVAALCTATEVFPYLVEIEEKKSQLMRRVKNLTTAVNVIGKLRDKLESAFSITETKQKIIKAFNDLDSSFSQFDAMVTCTVISDETLKTELFDLSHKIKQNNYNTKVLLHIEEEELAAKSQKDNLVLVNTLIGLIGTEDDVKTLAKYSADFYSNMKKVSDQLSDLVENLIHADIVATTTPQKKKITGFLAQEIKRHIKKVTNITKLISDSDISSEAKEAIGSFLTLLIKENDQAAAYVEMGDIKNARDNFSKALNVANQIKDLTKIGNIENLISEQEVVINGMDLLIASDQYVVKVKEPFIVDGITTLGEYVPTPQEIVHEFLAMADITADDVLLDLGCGDARLLIESTKKYGNQSIGVDFNPIRVEEGKNAVIAANLVDKIKIFKGDAAEADFDKVTVVTVYLLEYGLEILKPVLQSKLTKGARVVSHDFKFKDWTPSDIKSVTDNKGDIHYFYLYVVEK